MAFSIKNVNLKGCLFGPSSPKDYRTVFKDTPVPDKVDLRSNCTSVEDQGQLGSCTANASVGALEYLYKVRDGQSPDLSRLFVYFNSRRLRGTTNMDSGAQISDAMASVLAFGACREDIWPYDITTYTNEPSQDAYQEALQHEAIQYSRVDGTDGSVSALAAGFPVVFGARIPERCFKEAEKGGVMPVPTDDEAKNAQGGHCMLIVGYDNPAKTFIVRNSWGQNWGDQGYCYIPFELLDKCTQRDQFWIIGELAKAGNFTVIRPGKTAQQRPASPLPRDPKPSGIADQAAKIRQEIRSSLDAEIDASSKRIEKLLSGTSGDKKLSSRPKGSDRVTCPDCNGSGVGSDGGTCATCGGNGWLPIVQQSGRTSAKKMSFKAGGADRVTCPDCNGSGVGSDGGTCPTCGGNGWLPIVDSTGNKLPGGKSTFGTPSRCPSCGGSGVNSSGGTCVVCSGTGLIGTY